MTDDEAFIRAIVDAPGDDAPRLIYADWLDERGDPRGAYLRAEVNWARSERVDTSALPKRARIAIDPVWLARVSRPPLGVCCDRIRFRTDKELPTPSKLNRLEMRIGIQLPREYRAFLLNYNGASPQPKWFPITDDDYGTIFSFFGIDSASRRKKDQWRLTLEEHRDFWSGNRGVILLPIGEGLPVDDWTYLCLRTRGRELGCVYIVSPWGDAADPVRQVAKSLPELLSNFIDIRPDWVRMIQDGDVRGFKKWLTAGGNIDERFQEGRFEPTTPLLSALEWKQDEIVRMLLKRKATVPQDLWYVYQDMIPDAIVDRVKPPNFVDPGPFDT